MLNKICYILELYWTLDNISSMMMNDDGDVCQQWVTDHCDDRTLFWYSIVCARELELHLDSFGCLDAEL